MAKGSQKERLIADNRRARHNYTVEDTLEVGIQLTGTEVKSLRAGQITFADAYASIEEGEMWLYNVHIKEYLQGNRFNHNPERPRKLLLHKRQIQRFYQEVRLDGYTLIPLRFYFQGSWVKVALGLCKGKKLHDQRQDIAKREAKRQIEQALNRRR
ncbi:MAG: SsrA-binding protein SmpB [Myxococcales bacterium]|nr:SsrA-binding protein SmpB [Myxococcales bacterium]MCB9641926.1 SsrA-binding protein SmpB [Myxococcales bacterium]